MGMKPQDFDLENGLIVDSREPWENVFEKLGQYDAPEYRLEALEAGADYAIVTPYYTMGVQRKTINDFTQSIGDLKETLFDLRQEYDVAGLLLEGRWKTANGALALRRGNKVVQTITLQQFHNFQLSQTMRGSPVYHTMSLDETCRALIAWHEYLQEPISGEQAMDTPVMLLTSLPSVGPDTAGKLLTVYGSVGAALDDIEEWDRIDGIGPKTVETVMDWLY